MAKPKPILLLDVDGVLNVFSPDYKERKVRLRGGRPFYPSRFAKTFMRWAWEHFDVHWCTAWFHTANLIARWAKLEERPHVGNHRERGIGDYKLRGAVRKFGRSKRPLIWIEDGIDGEAINWLAKESHRWYIHTLADMGVTKWHCDRIACWLGVPFVKD